MIYLDNGATTRTLPAAAARMYNAASEDFYNPSSAYHEAVRVEKEVTAARITLAVQLSVSAQEIIYTSGGTESNNMAIFGLLTALRGKRRIITTMTEHPSVYGVFRAVEERGAHEVVYLPARADGTPDLAALDSALSADTALLSCMHVNNETGAVTDLGAIAALVRKKAPETAIHSDGVQAFCKLAPAPLPVDFYSLSFHKLHAPKGVGALYAKAGVRFAGGQIGGAHERGLRAGTTNVPGVLAADTAIREYAEKGNAWRAHMMACKLRLAEQLTALPDLTINGPAPHLGAPHILNFSVLGVRGEVMLHALAERDILVSTGSACSSRKGSKHNRVLSASGISAERQESAIRMSLCPFNTMEEMDIAAETVMELATLLRRYKRR
ncbi:MAG: cysteine desulfurase [Clostridiales bacterium]|nr:cysteine desulfurase [Clostridiales bacterium]